MKTLIFVRHGKSSWEYGVDDRDRPLKERGITDAHLVAKWLSKERYRIDRFFSSPANRALHTAMIFARELDVDLGQFYIINDLYDFSGASVLPFLRSLEDGFSSIMVFGHNYAFTSLVNMLGDDYIENLPTAGMAIIEIPVVRWQDLEKGKTRKIIVPKALR